MAREFLCIPDPAPPGSSHFWVVEDSPLAEEVKILNCPDHAEDGPAPEAPAQNEEA